MAKISKIALKQARKRFEALSDMTSNTIVRKGWIHYMRNVLGMTLQNLADKTELHYATVAQSERNEKSGKLTLNTLNKMADAMNCKFVYAFVPREDPEQILRKQALNRAREIMEVASTHMELEDQEVKSSFDERIESLADELIAKGKIW